MTAETPFNLSRIRVLALAGASAGAAVVLLLAWALFLRDVEPALGALALPALAGPILQPKLASGIFVRYLLIGAIASGSAILLGLLLSRI